MLLPSRGIRQTAEIAPVIPVGFVLQFWIVLFRSSTLFLSGPAEPASLAGRLRASPHMTWTDSTQPRQNRLLKSLLLSQLGHSAKIGQAVRGAVVACKIQAIYKTPRRAAPLGSRSGRLGSFGPFGSVRSSWLRSITSALSDSRGSPFLLCHRSFRLPPVFARWCDCGQIRHH
jgi:hypothetical protein